MPFDSGTQSVTFCYMPKEFPKDAVERFAAKRAGNLNSVMDEPQIGWVSGRHLLENRIDDDTATCGGYLHLHLRTAVRKIPSALFKAECRIEELALMQANNSFAISRKQKKEIRETVTERLLKDMPPSLSGIPFVVDPNHQTLLLGAVSQRQIDSFLGFLYETVGFEPIPLFPETLIEHVFDKNIRDLNSLSFTSDPGKVDDEPAIGRDFATWLWYFQEEEGGTFDVNGLGQFAIAIDGPLTFAAESSAAMESVVRKGMPTISAEAKAALRVGKKLTRAKYNITRGKETWTFTLDADSFALRSVKLPDGEELDPMSHFQERILFFNILRETFNTLFGKFLEQIEDTDRANALQDKVIAWAESLRSV